MILKLINLEQANENNSSVFPAIVETFAAVEYAIDMHIANGVKAAIAKEINDSIKDGKIKDLSTKYQHEPQTKEETQLMEFSGSCLTLILIYGENEMKNKPHNTQIVQTTIMNRLKHLRAKYATVNDVLVILFHGKVSAMINDLETQRQRLVRANKKVKKEKKVRSFPFGRF